MKSLLFYIEHIDLRLMEQVYMHNTQNIKEVGA